MLIALHIGLLIFQIPMFVYQYGLHKDLKKIVRYLDER